MTPVARRREPSATRGRQSGPRGSGSGPALYSPPVADSVSIVGATGALGFGLTVRLARAGTPIVLGSRDAARAVEAAGRAQEAIPAGAFEGLDNAGAAARSPIVVLCVPFRSQSETLTNLKETLVAGQIVVDATAPLAAAVSGKATRVLGVWQGSAAQQAQEMVPDGVHVVSALHTVGAAALRDLDAVLDEDVLVCGDRKDDKQAVIELLGRIDGLRCVDCGRLEMARITEQLTALLIGINIRYKAHSGIRITGLPDAAPG
jgi:8-hydroxy-5-deazaflavin:NADPH oxidoreductase